MKDARLRQPVKADYTHALGHAAYCFAICEWNVVWSCEKISPGSLRRIVDDELTAGQIARVFIDLTARMKPSPGRDELAVLAERFRILVRRRNEILHGKPCTGPNGEARLSAPGVLEIPDLEAAADSFSQCAIEVNALLHGFLSK
jgi:hypothetical protein